MVAGVGFEPTTSGPRVSAFFRDSPGKSQPGFVVLGGLKTEKAERLGPASKSQDWLRGLDLNQRPPGYEPDELPGCSTPRWNNSGSASQRQTQQLRSANERSTRSSLDSQPVRAQPVFQAALAGDSWPESDRR